MSLHREMDDKIFLMFIVAENTRSVYIRLYMYKVSQYLYSEFVLSHSGYCFPPFSNAGDIKLICPSVIKTLIWLLSSKVLMIEH